MTVAANENYLSGYVVGTGAALNVSLGFIPRKVHVTNVTDGDLYTKGILGKMIAFTSGGVNTPVANQRITGNTSGAVARIKQVILISGTFAGGDAAGFFVADADDITGTFTTETVCLDTSASGNDDASVVAAVEHGTAIAAAEASVTGNAGITSYVGSSSAAKGFTIGSTVSESAKLLYWEAWR